MTRPDGLRLSLEHDGEVSARELGAVYASALSSFRAGALNRWYVGTTTEGVDAGGLGSALANATPEQSAFTLQTASGAMVTATRHDGWTVECWPPDGPDPASLVQWLHGCVDVVGTLADDGTDLGGATLARSPSPAYQCVPAPPLARWNHLIAFPADSARTAYSAEVSFWSLWDGFEDHRDLRLAWRALDAVDDEDWTRSVLADQLDLARAARPGATRWADRWDSDCAPELVARPDHGLESVGYLVEEQVLELAGSFDPGEHVPLADLLTVRALIATGQTREGHVLLGGVRIVFPDEAMARREAVPLLDAGAEVTYLTADGTRQRVNISG